MGYIDTYNEWKRFATDKQTAAELAEMEGNDEEIKSRFQAAMSFGTAGLRSKLGAGTSRMNIYTVGLAAQGLSDYVLKQGRQDEGMAVAYDTRKNSDVFADMTARVFAANGIKTYLFEQPTSVPELSFAIRRIGTFGGVVITASHNPKEYNGFKAYAPWGGQLLAEASSEVTKCIDALPGFNAVKQMDMDEAVLSGLVTMLGEEMDEAYYDALLTLSQRPENIRKYAEDIRFVYTPLFGTGMRTFSGVMKRLPYHCSVIESQQMPNAEFPGVSAPNPEDENTMRMATRQAREISADLAFGTDPDADRLGVAIPNDQGEYIMMSGNQVGCVIADYLLRCRRESGELKPSDFIVKSFVSTRMADDIAAHYGIESVTVPTGFKWISDIVSNQYKDRHFVLGFEESCGFLSGSFIGDKDGVMAGLLLLEVLCDCKARGGTMYERLRSLYQQYGWHKEKVVYALLEGADGMARIKNIMQSLRESAPQTFGGQRIVRYTDYLSGIAKDKNGESRIDFPKSDALEYTLESGWLCIRPSGTEPKVRVYCGVSGETNEASQALLDALKKDASALLKE